MLHTYYGKISDKTEEYTREQLLNGLAREEKYYRENGDKKRSEILLKAYRILYYMSKPNEKR